MKITDSLVLCVLKRTMPLLLTAAPLSAADRYYDVDPATAPIDGGSANWSDSNWKSAADGTEGVAWAANDTAIFNTIVGSPAATTISLSGTQSAAGVIFNATGYTLTNGTLSVGGNWITMNADGAIGSALSEMRFKGSAEATVSGGGALGGSRIVLGDGGGTTVTVRQTAGTITTSNYMMIGGNNVANSRGNYIMDGGSLTVLEGAYFGWGSASSSGTFTQNGGTVTIGKQGLQLGIGGGSGSYILNSGTLDSRIGNDSLGGSFTFGGGTFKASSGFTADTQRVSSTTIASGATAIIDTVGHTVTWSTPLIGSEAAGVTKRGLGTLILNGNYTGNLRVESGLLRASSATSLGTGLITIPDVPSAILASTGGGIDLNGFSFTNDIYVGNRSSGPADSGAVQNSAAGTTSVLSGNVQIGGENYGGGAGNTVFQGVVSGGTNNQYAFFKRDAGTWTFESEANTFDGFWYQIGGTTEVKKLANINEASSLGRATTANMNQVRFGFNGSGGGRILYTGTNASTSDRAFILQGDRSASNNRIDASGTVAAATLTLNGNVTAGSGYTFALGGTNAGVNTFAGTIGNGANLALLKDGSTTWRLTGSNTYTGATTVQAGRLVVDGSIANSTVTVQSGAVLGGSGSIGGLIVSSGGTIAPGNSPGTQTVSGNAVWNAGANYNWEIYDATGGAGTGWDLLNITGTLDLSALTIGSEFNINLWSLSALPQTSGAAINFNPAQNYTWTIASAAGGITGYTGTGQFSINTFATNGTGGFANALNDGSFSVLVATNGKDLNLVFTAGSPEAVPEPGTWAAAALLAGGAAYMRWRKRAKVS